MSQISYDGKPTLYLVPTPIGNLDDITVRSLNILKTVDIILCEDTRNTGILLRHYDIHKKLMSCHEYNESNMIQSVISFLEKGSNVGFVTDQGTPIISDPGYVLSKFVIDNGFNVISLPGATAFVPALSMSGIEPSPFLFYGFLDSKDSKRRKELEELKDNEYTIIFYEAPHRIIKTLELMKEILGDREISISREITKKFETVYRGKFSEVIPNIPDKGEFVIVVSGAEDKEIDSNLSVKEAVNLYIKAGLDVMSSIKKVAKDRGVTKGEIYKEYHQEEE